MDWLKFVFQRLFGLLSSLVPGSVALLLVVLHRPDIVNYIWLAQTLSYETKLIILFGVVFSAGFSFTYLFHSLIAGISGGIGGVLGPPKFDENVPWRSMHWRSLLIKFLGDQAPPNIAPWSDKELTDLLTPLSELPAQDGLEQMIALRNQQSIAIAAEAEWQGWWTRFHLKALSAQEPVEKLYQTVSEAFQMASILMLLGMVITPQLRLWWVFVICLAWTIHFIFRITALVSMVRDPWGSFNFQITFLQNQIEKRIKSSDSEAET